MSPSMAEHSLYDIYKQVHSDVRHIFVVPLIRYNYPSTDYLSLLYQPLEETHPEIVIHSTSAIHHYTFVWAQLTRKKPILHYHWLEFQDLKSMVGMPYKLICLALFRLFGGTLIWTVHNLSPHDKKWVTLHKIMHRWMARRAHRVLVHSHSAHKLAADYLKIDSTKISVFPHPVFPSKPLSKVKARQLLETEKKVNLPINIPLFLVAGAISEYKNIPSLIKLFKKIDSSWALLIAGYVKKGHQNLHHQILQASEEDPRIYYRPGFIAEDEYPILYSAADVCVFNFKDILTSGSVEMALAYSKPVIAPKTGGLIEYKNLPNVHLFDNEQELTTLLRSFSQNLGHG